MAHLVICPHCKKGLRSSAPFAVGVTIQCPACHAQFATGSDSPAVAVPPKLLAPVRAKSAPIAALVGRPAHQVAAKALPPLPVADPLDDDLEEVRPRPKPSPDLVAGGRVPPRSKAGLMLGLAGGMAVLAVLAVTAFVWPGFLVNGRPPSQARTLLAYVPANSTIIAGAQIGLFRKEPKFQAKWNEVQQQIAQFPNFPADARALLNDADEIIVGSGIDLQSSAVFVCSTEQPFDPDKVKRLAKAGAAQTVLGQTIYPVNDLVLGRTGFLALPTDNILVLGFMPADDFARLLAGAKQARLHPDLQEQVEHAHSALVWVAARFDPGIKQKMNEANDDFGQAAAGFLPELPKLVGIIQRGKGALVSIDLGDQNLKLSIGVTCQDGADAGQCSAAVGSIWNQAKLLLGFAKSVPKFGKLLGEVQQSFAVEQRDHTVFASVQLNQDTLFELADALPQFAAPGLPPGFNPAPKKEAQRPPQKKP